MFICMYDNEPCGRSVCELICKRTGRDKTGIKIFDRSSKGSEELAVFVTKLFPGTNEGLIQACEALKENLRHALKIAKDRGLDV